MTKTTKPDVYNLAAQTIHLMPDGWKWCTLQSIESPYGPYARVTGAVPGVYARGPRKGKPKWPPLKHCQVFQFTPDQLEQVRLDWESATEKCFSCGGDGKEFFKWSKNNGPEYRQCRRCDGTGHRTKPTTSQS